MCPEPETPRIYDAVKATEFVVAWTGLDPDLVDRVLDAKFRYLELAGIAQSEDDETLLREREVYRHLLPETPDFIDGREREYLALVTGLDQDTVLKIEQGEMAYQDSLDIIEWDDEADREARLGAPDLLEDEPADGERRLFEGHGNHWECLFPDAETGIAQCLPEAIERGELVGSHPSPSPDFQAVHALEQRFGTGLSTLLIIGDRDDQKLLATAYPVAGPGAVHRLEIDRVRRWSGALEAVVEAATSFGARLAFFDIGHHAHPEALEEGGTGDIELAAFAYHLGPAPDQVFEITQEEAIRQMRATEDLPAEQVTDLSHIQVHSAGLACLFPHPSGNPDDMKFQGPITAVDLVEGWGQAIFRLDITALRDEEPFTLPVFAARHTLPEGYTPKVGDDVRGVIWMQGRVVGA